jgi:APA family basic amino acid/polyamine antiporter
MGVWAATAVVTGEAISLGIFLTPAAMAKSLGSPLLLGAVWCGMAVMTLAGALCFTELAVRNPHDGGEYLYLRRGFGRQVAFLYGWMAAVVMYPGLAAALCVGAVPIRALLPIPARPTPLPGLILPLLGATVHGTPSSSVMTPACNRSRRPLVWQLYSGGATCGAAANSPLSAERRPGSTRLSPPLRAAISRALPRGWGRRV